MLERQRIAKFIWSLQMVYVFVRYNSASNNLKPVLQTFDKYLSVDLFTIPNALKELRKEIKGLQSFEFKQSLLDELGLFGSSGHKKGIIDTTYIGRHLPVLKIVNSEMLRLIETNNTQRIRDLADAVYNYPEMLLKGGLWNPSDFWRECIERYRNKWDGAFLDEWKGSFEK